MIPGTPGSPETPTPPPAATTFTIGGVLAGLAPSTSLVLGLADASGELIQTATLSANGSYSVGAVPAGTTYNLQIVTHPVGQSCTITNGMGTVSADVTSIHIDCATSEHTIGGQVTGWNVGLVLRNYSTGEQLARSGTGPFTFVQRTRHGSAYNVGFASVNPGQSCSISNSNGTVRGDVESINVECHADAAPPPTPPATPTGLSVTYEVKAYKLSWNTSTGATRYELAEDPDGAGPAAETNNTTAATATATQTTKVELPNLLKRVNAQYRVRACNAVGCSAYTAALTPNLAQAVGYFKASNTKASDEFGYVVALSGDGNTLAIGAHLEDSSATGIGGDESLNDASNAGAVYVFTRSTLGWVQQAYVKASNTEARDEFGRSLTLSADGNTLAVGAFSEDSSAVGIDGDKTRNDAPGSGAVYVFTRSTSTWSQQAYLKASNTGAGDQFGWSVSLSGDGSKLAVGATQEASNAKGIDGDQANNLAAYAGAVYVFSRTGIVWSQQAYVKASNTEFADIFGEALSLSADGRTLAVGAYGEDSNATGVDGNQANNSAAFAGAVYVFAENAGTWAQQAYVKASNTGANHYFGYTLSVSGDGNTLAVGAHTEGNIAYNSGAVYVFSRSGTSWSQQAYLKASNAQAQDRFGSSVALSSDGNTLAIGAFFESSNATGIGGDQANNDAVHSGAVYVFANSAGTWNQQAYVKASNTGSGDRFGNAVALSTDGNALAVGALYEESKATGIGGDQTDNTAGSAGAAYVY